MPKKTLRELQQTKFLTVINDDKNIIEKIVFPNDFQIGADEDLLASSLSVYGRIIAGEGFSGSLTQLKDGTSYLIAGTNISIVTQSNGSVIINGLGGGGGSGYVLVSSGTLSVPAVSEIKFGDGLFVTDNQDTTVTINATIGEPEDGTYSDGIFTDFTPHTPIGIAIDRFNEILKLFAPAPAPDLDYIDVNDAGIDAYLSFGSSNNLEGEPVPYYSVGTTAGFSAVDVNGSYSFSTSGNNYRAGIFDGTQNITGDLNEDILQDGINYPDNSFGNADQGLLKLELNGIVIHTTDLSSFAGSGDPGSGSGSDLNLNGSGFISLSTAAAGKLVNGSEFESFKHRTGQYTVSYLDQRNGWNYLKVIHQIGATSKITNYVEWVNDSDSNQLTVSQSDLTITGNDDISLSGVNYYTDITATYTADVENVYRNIYDSNNITFTTSYAGSLNSGVSFSLNSQSKPQINLLLSEDNTKTLSISAQDTSIASGYMLNGSLTAGINVTHPLKSNLTNAGQETASGILSYNLTNTSTDTVETFLRENYRLLSGSYDNQTDVTNLLNVWNSNIHMLSPHTGYDDGLQFFNQKLLSPKNTLNNGDFTVYLNSPGSQPDYSVISGKRTFYRAFRNTTGSTKYSFTVSINGTNTSIVNAATTLDSSKINVFLRFPNNTSRETGWLDLASPFVLDSYSDNSGAHISNGTIVFDSTLNALNYVTLGTVGVENNQYIMLKIVADTSWLGDISNITVSFNATSGVTTSVPDLYDVGSNNTGVTSNLSFGPTKSISGYTNVSNIGNLPQKALNDTFQSLSSFNDLRRATFNGNVTLEGVLNDDITGVGTSYVNDSFSDANSGSLKLEVNGSVIHTLDLAGAYNLVGTGNPGSGTGTNLNANGSGFINISIWKPSEYSNTVPNYLEIYRTAKFRVTPASQRNGWNYLKIIHSIPGQSDRVTNYVDWVNDTESQNNNITTSQTKITQFGDDNTFYLSGVKYFIQPTGSIETVVDNVYKNIYSNASNAIEFISLSNATAKSIKQTGPGLISQYIEYDGAVPLQDLNTNIDSQNEKLYVTGSIQFSQTTSLSGTFSYVTHSNTLSCGGRIKFLHPIKTTHTCSLVTTTNMLVYSSSDTSNANTNEYFTGEKYRLQKSTYSGQDSVTNPLYTWNSKISINQPVEYPNYSSGLLVYDTLLISPYNAGEAGKFRNKHETTNPGLFEGPDDNQDYSSLINSTRNYLRSFLNNTTNDRPSITVTLYGDAILVPKTGAALGANKYINFEIKIPGKTGWLDLGRPSAGSGNISDGDGCLSGNLNGTITTSGVANICTFNGQTVDGTSSGQEYIVINVSANKEWTGYLDRIDIAWST